jgi:glycosyltransferase involved in cell wall biosynthesis
MIMSKSTTNNQPFVSIVVCTYNGAGHIGATLTALVQQTYPQKRYEIIVVDDGSTDDTAAIVKEFEVQLIQLVTNQGLGTGRNAGLHAAKGEIIAYTDDDCLPDQAWIEHMVKPYDRSLVMAVGGEVFAVSRQTPTERYMEAVGYGNPAPFGLSGGSSPINRLIGYVRQMANPLHTALQNGQALQEIFTLNASYRTACLREIGGFDISLRAAEDSDVSARMYEKFPHYTIVYGQKAQVGHRHRRVLWPWVAQNYVRSQDAFIQIRKEHRIPPIFPLPVLTLVIAAGASFFGPVAGLTALIVSPVLLYWWWQVRVIRKPQIDRILFPYMQLAIESAVLSGYIRAFLKTL